MRTTNGFVIGQLCSHSTDGPQGLHWHERRVDVKPIPTQGNSVSNCLRNIHNKQQQLSTLHDVYNCPHVCAGRAWTRAHTQWYKYTQWGWNTPTCWRKKICGCAAVLLRFSKLLNRLLLRHCSFGNDMHAAHYQKSSSGEEDAWTIFIPHATNVYHLPFIIIITLLLLIKCLRL